MPMLSHLVLSFQKCQGEECGNANALASSIISQRSQLSHFPTSFLFLTGDKTKSTISESLISAGFHVELLQVYETRNQDINLLDLIGSTVILFSPSGIPSLGKNIEAITAANINWISIGPSTFKALFDIGIQSVQAESPNPDGVVNALLKLSKDLY
jgi:uroporphyrinogen-III synthase